MIVLLSVLYVQHTEEQTVKIEVMKVKTSEGNYFFVHQVGVQILDTNLLYYCSMVKIYTARKNTSYMCVPVCL